MREKERLMSRKITYGFICVLGLIFLFFIGFSYGEYEEKKQQLYKNSPAAANIIEYRKRSRYVKGQ